MRAQRRAGVSGKTSRDPGPELILNQKMKRRRGIPEEALRIKAESLADSRGPEGGRQDGER